MSTVAVNASRNGSNHNSALLAQIRELDEQQRAKSIDNYADLVRRTWRGEEIDPHEALAVLDTAGKDSIDLEADCLLLDELNAHRKQAQRLPGLHAELADLRQQEADAKAMLESAHQAYRAAMQTIDKMKSEVARMMDKAQASAQALRTDERYRNEDVYAERMHVEHRANQIRAALSDVTERVREDQNIRRQEREQAQLDDALWKERAKGGRASSAELERLQKAVDELPAKYAARVERRDQLREQLADVESQLRELDAKAIA